MPDRTDERPGIASSNEGAVAERSSLDGSRTDQTLDRLVTDGGTNPGESDDNGDEETESNADTDPSPDLRERVPWWSIANVIGVLLLIAVVLPFVIYTVPQVVGAEHSYVVLSGSMEPTVDTGSVIVIDDVSVENVETGDVITFTTSGETRPTTHRVIEVVQEDGQRQFRTKGDANEEPDQSLVSPGQVEGRMMTVGGYPFVIPYIGYVIQFAGTQLGMITLVFVPLTLFVLNEIWRIVSSTRKSGTADSDDGSAESDKERAAVAGETVTLAVNGDEATAAGEATDWEAKGSVDSSRTEDADGADGDVETGAESATEGEEAEEEAGSGITIHPVELRLGLVVLAAFTAYGVWVAYVTLESWAVGVAVSVGVTTLLLAGLYFFGGSSVEGDSTGSNTGTDAGGSGTVSVRRGSVDEATLEDRGQPVASFGILVDLAAATDAAILQEGNPGRYFVPTEEAVYVFTGTPGGRWADQLGIEASSPTDDAAEDDGGPASGRDQNDTGEDLLTGEIDE